MSGKKSCGSQKSDNMSAGCPLRGVKASKTYNVEDMDAPDCRIGHPKKQRIRKWMLKSIVEGNQNKWKWKDGCLYKEVVAAKTSANGKMDVRILRIWQPNHKIRGMWMI